MRGKKKLLSAMAAGLGVGRVLSWIPERPGLLVLCYHRIGDPAACAHDSNNFSATAEQFEQQIKELSKRYSIATISQVVDLASDPERLEEFKVLITFDDGYIDNYEVAFPILKKYGVPATFFLPTSYTGTNRIPWWDQIAYAVKHTQKTNLVVEYPRELRIDLGTCPADEAIRRILRAYKADDMREPARFLSEVASATGVRLSEEAQEPVFMNWSQARIMLQAGMDFGSHTHDHNILAKASKEDQVKDFVKSRAIFEECLGSEASTLAFPVGTREAFTQHTIDAASIAGFRASFSAYGGVNRPDTIERFDILREHVSLDTTRPLLRFQAEFARVAVV